MGQWIVVYSSKGVWLRTITIPHKVRQGGQMPISCDGILSFTCENQQEHDEDGNSLCVYCLD
jgi:hypothetical protein